MNKKMLAVSLLLVLTMVCMVSAAVKAQTTTTTNSGQWITSYTIWNGQNGAMILQKNLVTGAQSGTGQMDENDEIKMEATINIATSEPSASLTLDTDMGHSVLQQNMYWAVSNGYNLGNFNPNSASISFAQNSGTLIIDCYGKLPANVDSQTAPNGVTLDVPTPITLMELKDASGDILAQISMNITDANIDNYLVALSSAQSSLKSYQSQGVDPGFISVYSSVISASQALEAQGFATAAAGMLHNLSGVAAPASAGTQALFIPVAVVLAVVAVLFAFLFLRIRGKVSYMQLVVEDQIKDLEGLSMRISRIDRAASSNLESVKDRLKRLVGM